MGIVTESIEMGQWLVIDELNRADVDKAFGEFFTVLSGKRVSLPFRDKHGNRYVIVPAEESVDEDECPIYVQRDWRLVGTMNTFDKASLYQLSYAFMRRFAFIDVPIPESSVYLTFIKDCISRFFSVGSESSLAETLSRLVEKVFLPSGGGLAKAGMMVGPAIPQDIIKYLGSRNARHTAAGTFDIVEAFVDSMEMFLFPQFEGQDRKHEEIVESIVTTAGIDGKYRDRIDKTLSIWTGFEKVR
jgi:hypothetical protein